MRTKNSMKNIYISILTQIIMTLLGFISRKIFIDSLGADYLGINGILTNVLGMLSLVEGGIGASITFSLYKPLADKDTNKIISLVQLYKKAYAYLSLIILFLSITIYPIALKIMSASESIFYLTIVYYIFVIRNIISYIFAHKWALINSDQKAYILAKYNLIFSIATTITRIIILMVTKNYILYLVSEILIFIIQNMYNSRKVEQLYPYIKTKEKYEIDLETKGDIVKNIKALFLHNIGGYCVSGTDNLLIGALINVNTVGLYSNYTMIIGQLSSLITPILGGIKESIGNLIAVEEDKKVYEVFNVTYLVNFWIYSWCTIFLFNLLEPFINWWLNEGLLLDKFTFIIILINFYLYGLRATILTFKSKSGQFNQDKYMPLLESVINLVSSIILARYFGLAGIFLGTTISTLLVPFWIQPIIVYKNVLKKPVKEYFKKYMMYVMVTLIAGYITTISCNTITIKFDFISLVMKGIICAIVPNIIYLCIFSTRKEFKYLLNTIKYSLGKGNQFTNTYNYKIEGE